MKKKTAGQICAEVFIEYNKKDIQKGLSSYDSFDIGMPMLVLQMYDALIENGFKGVKVEHPLNRIAYVSRLVALDCKRKDGYWNCNEQITYPGIQKRPVNVYRLRDKL